MMSCWKAVLFQAASQDTVNAGADQRYSAGENGSLAHQESGGPRGQAGRKGILKGILISSLVYTWLHGTPNSRTQKASSGLSIEGGKCC